MTNHCFAAEYQFENEYQTPTINCHYDIVLRVLVPRTHAEMPMIVGCQVRVATWVGNLESDRLVRLVSS